MTPSAKPGVGSLSAPPAVPLETLGEDTAKAYEILVTDAVRDAIGVHDGMSYEPIDAVPSGANSAYRVAYR